MRLKNIIHSLVILVLTSCSDHLELYDRPFAFIETKPVVDITADGAEFHAEVIKSAGIVLDHGFVWEKKGKFGEYNVVLNINESNRKSLGPLTGNKFSHTVSSTLEPGGRYQVRSYVRTTESLVYGNMVSFISKGSRQATILGFSPESGSVLDTLTIRGINFSYKKDGNIVKFNSIEASVISTSDTLLKAIVPQTLTTDDAYISVNVAGYSVTAEKKFTREVAGPWRKKADFPGSAGTTPVSFFVGNKFYIGPNHTKAIWGYDPATNVWTRKADFPGKARFRSFAFVCDGKAYVGLGWGQDDFEKLSDFWRYDPSSDSWTKMNNFPGEPRANAESFSIDNVGYLVGGETLTPSKLRDVWKYTTATDSWQRITDAPIDVTGQSNFILQGKAYHLHSITSDDGASESRLYEFNPVTEFWAPKSNVPSTVMYPRHNKAVAGGYIINGAESVNGTFFKYDPTLDTITSLVAEPTARWGVASFEFNGRQYIVGGFSTNDYSTIFHNETWEFDFTKYPK